MEGRQLEIRRAFQELAGEETDQRGVIVTRDGTEIQSYDVEEASFKVEGAKVSDFISSGAWNTRTSAVCREYIRKQTGIDLVFRKRYVSTSKKRKFVDVNYYANAACSYHTAKRGSCGALYRIYLTGSDDGSMLVRITRADGSSDKHTHLLTAKGFGPSLRQYKNSVSTSRLLKAFKSAGRLPASIEAGLLSVEFKVDVSAREVRHLRETDRSNFFSSFFGIPENSSLEDRLSIERVNERLSSLDLQSKHLLGVNRFRGIIRSFQEYDLFSAAPKETEFSFDATQKVLRELTQTGASSEDTLRSRAISLILFTNRALVSVWTASQLGYICSYMDATGDRVTGFRSTLGEKAQLLHTVWAFSAKTLFPRELTRRGSGDTLNAVAVVCERISNSNKAREIFEMIQTFLKLYTSCFGPDLRDLIALSTTDKCATLLKATCTCFNGIEVKEYISIVGKCFTLAEVQESKRSDRSLFSLLEDHQFCLTVIQAVKAKGVKVLVHVGYVHALRAADYWIKKSLPRGVTRNKDLLLKLVKPSLASILDMPSYTLSRASLRVFLALLRAERLFVADCTIPEVKMQYEKLALGVALGSSEIGTLPVVHQVTQRDGAQLVLELFSKTRFTVKADVVAGQGRMNNEVPNPWHSLRLAAYLQAEYLDKWPILCKTSVALVRAGLKVHAFKSNMLAESVFSKSKQDQGRFSLAKRMPIAEYVAFKYVEDLYQHRNFAKGVLKTGLSNAINWPVEPRVAVLPPQETVWQRFAGCPFQRLFRQILDNSVPRTLVFVVDWIKSGKADSSLKVLMDDAGKLVQSFMEVARADAVVTDSLAYQTCYQLLCRPERSTSTMLSSLSNFLEAFANSREEMVCAGESCDYSVLVRLKVRRFVKCSWRVADNCASKSGSISSAPRLLYVCPKLLCRCSTAICEKCYKEYEKSLDIMRKD